MEECDLSRCFKRLLIAGTVFVVWLSPVLALAQQHHLTLSGVVINEAGNALPQATIYIEGSSFSATTDHDGRFRLRLPRGTHRIVCSMVGYRQWTQKLNVERDHRLELV